jgi:hypothetical protein
MHISRDTEGKNENCIHGEGVEIKTHTGSTGVRLAREPRTRLHFIGVEKSATAVVLRKIRGSRNMGMMI